MVIILLLLWNLDQVAGFKLFRPNYIAPMKKEFNDKLNNILKRKKSNSAYLIDSSRYQDIVKEVIEVKSKWNKDFNDFKMLANYDVLKVNGVDRLIQPRTDTNPNIKFYIHTDELFGVLHTMHLLFNHADREKMDHELKTKYCNVSKEAIKIYLTCCKVCKERQQ